MLQSIRDHTQGWIAGAIVSLLILSFALWGIHSYLVGGGDTTIVAKVNGVEISKSQLAVGYERLRRQLQTQYSSNYQLPEQAEASLKERALQALINIQVLKQASFAQGYRISSSQIDSFLESMPEFQINGQFSMTRFQKILETTLYNPGDFLELIRTSLLIDQPRLGIIFTSFALPNEILDSIALVNQERNIQYLVLPLISSQAIQISQDKIRAYYNEHADEFKTPEQVSIEYVELSLKDLMNLASPSEQALKNYYTDNSNSFVQPGQWKLESVIVPIAETADKAAIAKAQAKAIDIQKKLQASNDTSVLVQQNALQKGNSKLQGWVALNQVPSELQKTIIGLTKVGQVSEPVSVHNGFEIFKVVAIKEAVVQPFEKVKDKVKETMLHQQSEEKFAELRDKLANTAYEHPESLAPVAQLLGLTVKTSELFTRDKGGKGVAAMTKVRQAAFSNDVLNLQNNSDVIQENNDVALVLRVKTHVPASSLSLASIQKQIVDKLKAVEVEVRSAKLADEIKRKLQAGMILDQAAQQAHSAWKDVGFIGQYSNKVPSGILDVAFALAKPKIDKPMTFATAKIPNGYAIVALKAVKNGVNTKDHEQYQVFAEQIQNTQGLIEYELYKQSLMNKAKIVTQH